MASKKNIMKLKIYLRNKAKEQKADDNKQADRDTERDS